MCVCLCFVPHPHPTPCNAFCVSSQMLWPKAILEASRQAFQNSEVARGGGHGNGVSGGGGGENLAQEAPFFFPFCCSGCHSSSEESPGEKYSCCSHTAHSLATQSPSPPHYTLHTSQI